MRLVLCESGPPVTHYQPGIEAGEINWMHVRQPDKFTQHRNAVTCPVCEVAQ